MGSSVKQCSIWLVQVWCIHDAPPCSDGRAPGRQKQTWANDIRTFCSIRRRSSEIAGMGRNLADWRCSERHRKNATQPEMFPIRSDSWSALGAYPATGSVVQLRNLDDFVAAICGIQQNSPRNLAKNLPENGPAPRDLRVEERWVSTVVHQHTAVHYHSSA